MAEPSTPTRPAPITRPTVAVRPRTTRVATAALIVASLIALVTIFLVLSRRQDAAGAPEQPVANASVAAPDDGSQQALRRIDTLRQHLAQNPDDAAAWYALGSLYREFEQFPDAEQAFRRAMQLQPNNPNYLAATGEAMLLTGRQGSEREAKPLFEKALTIRPDHPQSRYFMATLKDLAGDHRGAVDDMIALIRSAPADAPWLPGVRNTLQEIATTRHIDIAGRLPPAPPPTPATDAIPGPTREQMEAARGIPPSQQDQMVQTMVANLAQKLQANPRDENRWMMLMRSYTVLNRTDDAAAALRSALAAFPDDAAAQQRLRAAAASLGISG